MLSIQQTYYGYSDASDMLIAMHMLAIYEERLSSSSNRYLYPEQKMFRSRQYFSTEHNFKDILNV
jgi:hypothetical protein